MRFEQAPVLWAGDRHRGLGQWWKLGPSDTQRAGADDLGSVAGADRAFEKLHTAPRLRDRRVDDQIRQGDRPNELTGQPSEQQRVGAVQLLERAYEQRGRRSPVLRAGVP